MRRNNSWSRKHPELYGGILTSELIRVKQSLAAPLDGSKSVRDVTDEKWLLLVLEETQLLAADTLVAGIASTCSNKKAYGYWREMRLHDLTRRSSATAGGSERGEHSELFHKIKGGRRTGQRLAAAIG